MNIRITSVEEPFDRPEAGQAAIELLGLADAMGLLPDDIELRALDWEAVRTAARHIARAGIATGLAPRLERRLPPDEAVELLRTLTGILEENPVPQQEWERLRKVFPDDELARLLGISATSVGRYGSQARKTPDAVAARLHFLARIVHHLEGAYNELGVRRWFRRPRTALDGDAPAAILAGDWDPDNASPLAVLELARSLGGVAAT